jgi:hypothetical protein
LGDAQKSTENKIERSKLLSSGEVLALFGARYTLLKGI